jgi:type I restriction enzyme S subunit
MAQKYKYLHLVNYNTFLLWDIKRYFMTQVASSHPIVKLGDYIQEEGTKYNISDKTKTYGILGVNNQTGIFDAYEENGSKIKQKYKKMQVGWIAYNPYRVNVGSIGIRTEEHLFEYISPAYVVFSCKKGLLPEFLFLLMKTDLFNKIIRENTTGSVRQNLNYSVLSNLQIPLPSLAEQNKIIAAYNATIAQAKQYSVQAKDIDKQIEKYLQDELEIETRDYTIEKQTDGFLHFINYSTIDKWGTDFMIKNIQSSSSTKYKTKKICQLCNISSGGTPNRGRKEYYGGNIPWIKTGELKNDILTDTEEKITPLGMNNSSAKLYPKGSLVVAMYGATIGKTAKLGVDATTNQACAVLFDIDNKQIQTDYLWLYLQSQTDKLKAMAYGGAQPNINAGIVANYEIPLPPFDTQNEIVERITRLRMKQKDLQQKSLTLRQQATQQFEQIIFA